MQGDTAKGFYALISGEIKIYKLSTEGKEQIIKIIRNSNIFGEVPVFISKPHPVNAAALKDAKTLFFSGQDFIDLLKQNAGFSVEILKFLSTRLLKITSLVESISLTDVPARVAYYIIGLDNNSSCTEKCFLNVSRSQLAGIVGTVPETLSRTIRKMKDNNIIDIDGQKITILDRDTLVLLSKNEIKL